MTGLILGAWSVAVVVAIFLPVLIDEWSSGHQSRKPAPDVPVETASLPTPAKPRRLPPPSKYPQFSDLPLLQGIYTRCPHCDGPPFPIPLKAAPMLFVDYSAAYLGKPGGDLVVMLQCAGCAYVWAARSLAEPERDRVGE